MYGKQEMNFMREQKLNKMCHSALIYLQLFYIVNNDHFLNADPVQNIEYPQVNMWLRCGQ